MKPSLFPQLLLFGSSLVFIARSLAGVPLAAEPFAYEPDSPLTGQNGGVGFASAWIESGSPSDYDTIGAGSLFFDYLGASGNLLQSRAPTTLGTNISRPLATRIVGTAGRTLWISFLVRKDTQQSDAPDDYAGLVLYPSITSAPALFIGDTGETNFYSLAIAGSGLGQVASNTVSTVSTSATLLLVKIGFRNGADRIDLFVNPDLSQGAPTVPSATKTDFNLADISALGFLAGLDATWSVDEIRIGNGFADVAPKPGKLANISTRVRVGTGDDALIGGFIITGDETKTVIVRAIGPSLAGALPDALLNPRLELHDGSGAVIGQNDDWRSDQEQEIKDTTVPPGDDRESAIVKPLAPGAYTAIVRGVDDTTGVGLVEVYDLQSQPRTRIANISTRGFVQTGDNAMIGGVIVTGEAPQRVIVRGLGPSLQQGGVQNALSDPLLELHDSSGALVAQNDNWRSDQEKEIVDTTVPPPNDLESAIVRDLQPGNYTAVLRGTGGFTGVALIEVYALN